MKAMGFLCFLGIFIALEFGMVLYFIQLIQLIQITEIKVASNTVQLRKLLTLTFSKLTFLYAKVMLWLSGMSVVGNGKVTHYVDYKHKDECFKYEVKVLPEDVDSRSEAQVFKHLGSSEFDVYKYRPS